MATSLNLASTQVAISGLTIATTTYASGDQLGTLMSFVMGAASGVIMSAVLVDALGVIGAVDCFIYDRSITVAADNAADAISDADALFKFALLSMPPPTASANNSAAHIDSLAVPYIANASSTIYVQMVTRSANTFFTGNAAALSLRLTYSKDS